MSRAPRLTAASALVIIVSAQCALADLTARDVWNDWKGYLESMGHSVAGTEAESGRVLTVSGAGISGILRENEGRFEMQFGTLTFTETGDGSVAISIPASMPMQVSSKPEQGEAMDLALDLSQSGMVMNATGNPGDIEYRYSAETIGVELAGLSLDGEEVPESDASASLGLEGVSGSTAVKVGELRDVLQAGSAEKVTYRMDMTSPDGSRAKVNGLAENVDFNTTLAIPLTLPDTMDASALLDAGLRAHSTTRFGANSIDFSGTGADGPVSAQSSSAGGALEVSVSTDGLVYDASQTQLSVKMQADAAPMPIAFDLADLAFHLATPAAETEAAQDFALVARLADLSISDELWSIFDPQAQFPRDPATLVIDLTGKARLVANLLDPSTAPGPDGPVEAPVEVESVKIDELRLRAVGAELSGTGALAFDNSQPDVGPVPEGSLDLRLAGGNALLDRLVAVGIIPEDQAMGARMMMGLFGVPAGEPDTLTSKIEFLEDGQIIANGQRIK